MTDDDQQGPLPPPTLLPPSSPPTAPQSRISRSGWLTVMDAMEYLDAVKLEFRDQPEVYDEFLAIMGRFKTKQMLPPDVTIEVARLFRGRNSLVLQFNRFLPEGYKIGPSDITRMEEEYVAKEQADARAAHAEADACAIDAGSRGIGRGTAKGKPAAGGMQLMEVDEERSVFSGDESEEAEREEGRNAFEFDHAIKYVTTIKRRFCDDPGTYKAFLDILHTYQREQKGINHVLEQVTDLFADQPDLLREFTYFLPDGVQAQAKERLDRAADEAEARLGMRAGNVRLHMGQRIPARRRQGGFQHSQGRSRQGHSSRDEVRGHRMQHGLGPGSQFQRSGDFDQDWRDPRGYGQSRGGGPHRSFSGGYGPRSQYSNGDVSSEASRIAARQQAAAYATASNDSAIRTKRVRPRRQAWACPEDYELGPDGIFKGPKKRAREAEQAASVGEARGWSSPDTRGSTIKPSPEHDLFDQARQVLSSGGDANDWTEFLKCLDLFSNRVFGREELVDMVQDLFETHSDLDLIDDFKALVYRRGSLEPPARDAMPTLGLSEINFQNANMCTPSYRELPEDYQLASCSGRAADEDAVLNDTWASVPVGSEDSNNFKHMRRNPHEEALFKMEDERFELDMLIDGVAAAIARLEPVEEEIEALKATQDSALGQTLEAPDETGGPGASPTHASEGADEVLPQIQYRLDRQLLGALHLSTVSRLYGDHGAEVLELLRKNPAVAVPVVLKRLRQKKQEWCAAREEAKIGWKELAQKNFHRSLDHRSHHFRREDRRHTSNRALLQEIKDRKVEEDPQKAAVVKAARETREMVQDAQNDASLLLGRVSPTSTAADVDSVSVEQGSAGDADVALDGTRSDAGARDSQEVLPVSIDNPAVTGGRPRSKEGIRLLRQQAEDNPPWYMFAHLTLSYPAEDTASVHKDVIDLLSHTLARRPPSEEDARLASTMVVDLLPTFFALEKPTLAANGGESRGVSGQGDPAQAVLNMPVLSSDDDSDLETSHSGGNDRGSDGQAGPSRVAGGGTGDSSSASLAVHAKGADIAAAEGGSHPRVAPTPLPQNQEIFFTTTDFYLALRMHHLLAERLAAAKRLCGEAGVSRQTVVASPQEVLQASAGVGSNDRFASTEATNSVMGGDEQNVGYQTFLGHLYDLLEEKISSERYDEGVRQLVGNQGYVLCNLDRLVVNLLQNLCRASADKVFHKLTQLYHFERTTQHDGVVPSTYKTHVQQLLRRSEKEVVRVQYNPGVNGTAASPDAWQLTPTLKMEYIGRLNVDGGGEEASCESDGRGTREADGTPKTDAPVPMEE